MEQTPVGVGKTDKQPADLEMVFGHGPDPGDQILADVKRAGFLVDLCGEVIAALGGRFVQGALEQIQGVIDLAS